MESRAITPGRTEKAEMEAGIAERFAAKSFRKPHSKTGWTLSPYGFGGRSCSPNEAGHARAL